MAARYRCRRISLVGARVPPIRGRGWPVTSGSHAQLSACTYGLSPRSPDRRGPQDSPSRVRLARLNRMPTRVPRRRMLLDSSLARRSLAHLSLFTIFALASIPSAGASLSNPGSLQPPPALNTWLDIELLGGDLFQVGPKLEISEPKSVTFL